MSQRDNILPQVMQHYRLTVHRTSLPAKTFGGSSPNQAVANREAHFQSV
jgi:hypothetical protein